MELIGELMDLEPAEGDQLPQSRPGTPLQVRKVTPATEAIRWIALFRLGLPDALLSAMPEAARSRWATCRKWA